MSILKYRNPSDPTQWLNVPAAGSPGLPAGGTAGQMLVKNSANNYDAGWVSADEIGEVETGTITKLVSGGTIKQNCYKRGFIVTFHVGITGVTSGMTMVSNIAQLPEGFRPPSMIYVPCFMNGGSWIAFVAEVNSNGIISLAYSGAAATEAYVTGTFVI